jgi:DNA-binding NtrC family response regulator
VFAATNRDLQQDVAAGRFRADLWFRLNAVEVALPPLRNRREDIPYLTSAFVADCARRLKKPVLGVTPAAERILASRAWDGNVRELRNTIERACMLAEGSLLTDRDITRDLTASRPADARAARQGPEGPEGLHGPQGLQGLELDTPDRVDTTDGVQRARIVDVLQSVAGNKQAAARILGLSRRAFYRRLERFGLHTAAPPVRPETPA